ncbi:kinetochore-associated Ndc80 complex subunit spc24 [Maudiozyma exigua]|uniref:Kinetochore protein Spc24 n=1 Tax=Maudiozyma exigua TaxID=34358 RepID=A0A9P6WD04_MAUEX|nr:kinetochore-associated Ndc80 complex subunit spc24 [Kazachstania exigua]
MDTLNNEFDLSQSINAIAKLRGTFNAKNVKTALNEIVEVTGGIEKDNEDYIKEEKESLLELQRRADMQQETLDTLKNELNQLKKETESIFNQDQLANLVKELDILEKENLEKKNRNDKNIRELAVLYNVNTDTDNGRNSNGSINIFARDEEEETKKILENPISRANLLKLKLFRSLGVIVDIKTQQVFIEDSDRLDVLMLNEGYSNYFKTKYIWERIKMNKEGKGATE